MVPSSLVAISCCKGLFQHRYSFICTLYKQTWQGSSVLASRCLPLRVADTGSHHALAHCLAFWVWPRGFMEQLLKLRALHWIGLPQSDDCRTLLLRRPRLQIAHRRSTHQASSSGMASEAMSPDATPNCCANRTSWSRVRWRRAGTVTAGDLARQREPICKRLI